uniref:Uncharacterized protein n=1 Tax=Glossina austeni TaxID=7395 RepID=A0A1A9UIC5_GLOAU
MEIRKEVSETIKVGQSDIKPTTVDTSNQMVNERGPPGSNVGMEIYDELKNRTPGTTHNGTRKIKVVFETVTIEFENVGAEMKLTIPRLYSAQNLSSTVTVMNACIMPNRITHMTDLNDLNCVVYAAAITTAHMLSFKIRTRDQIGRNIKMSWKTPREKRLQDKVKQLRIELGRLTAYAKGERSKKNLLNITKMLRVYTTHQITEYEVLFKKDEKRQKLVAYAKS